MSYRKSLWSQLSSNWIHLLIRAADRARNAAPSVLLMGILLVAGAAWFASNTSAHVWGWKAWEKLFGHPAIGDERPAALVTETSGTGGTFTITTIDEPNAGTTALMGTVALGMNASQTITGMYINHITDVHGFVRTSDGTFTSFDAPDAGANQTSGRWSQGTVGIGIDTAGDVVGIYGSSDNAFHGFVREANGTLTEFDDPNAPTASAYRGTGAMAINDSGQIVGFYITPIQYPNSMMAYHGFLRDANGNFTTIDAPGAGTGDYEANFEGTIAMAINASGAITGSYVDSNNARHGFIRSAAGNFTTFDAPGATSTSKSPFGFVGTFPMSIDSEGDVVGSYTDSKQIRHGFIRTASGTITTFDAPGANTTALSGTVGGTLPVNIDPTGSYITGTYTDSSGLAHGFVYYLPLTTGASFMTFSAPAAAASVTIFPLSGTAACSVNASGTVAGSYVDSNNAIHGFVYTPTATAPPTFSPTQGTYDSTQTVTISDGSPAATIYYTTDGSTPTVGSTPYTEPITVSSSETINAMALASGYVESSVASATYTIRMPAATPTFSPTAGTYASAQTVTISDSTPGAIIYYTINGTTPTTSSAVYNGPISVSSSETIEAIAVASGYTDSAVASAAYTINLPAAVPTFSVPTGTYTSAQTVAISDSTPGAIIYYTTNGSTPTTSSTVYNGPITVSSTETIEAIAVASGYTDSAVTSAIYTINLPLAATPTFSVAAGTYTSTQTVAINDSTPGAVIYYTINGTTPTTSSTVYSGPITVSSSETIQAIASAGGYSQSAVASAAYTINLPAATPTFSVAPGTYTSAQTVAISDSTPGAIIYYTMNGTAPTTSSIVYSNPITVSSSETIEAIAVASGYTDSAVASAIYTINLPLAATPTFSVAAGTYTSTQTVTISDSTPGAIIYYTTNGVTPTASSTVYSGAITVSSTETIEAIAVASGYTSSAVASATYTINLPAATPTFSVPGGTYTSAQTVTISDSTPGAVIYYTTSGTTPTTGSVVYSGPITVSSTETIEAIAVAAGYSVSAVASAAYTINLPTATAPTFSIPGGTYTSAQTVTLSDATPAATIYFTTNGTAPTTSSTIYSGAITVSSSETIEAIAAASGYSNSAVASAAYTINLPLASFTLGASPGALTVNSGSQGAVTLTVTPQNGFNAAVSFACSGLPAGASCSFNPATVTPSGGSAATTQLTISANALAKADQPKSKPWVPITALAAGVFFFMRKRRTLPIAFLIIAAFVGMGIMTGCGGSVGGGGGKTPVTSTATVTATSGSIQQTAQVSLTVD